MQDIRIYDFEFNLLAVESKVISSNWKLYFNDIGKAEIHLSKKAESIPLIFDNKYLFITQGEKQAVVTAKQIGADCVIYGRTPDWLLSRRILTPLDILTKEDKPISGNAETVIRYLVKNKGFEGNTFFELGETAGITDETEVNLNEMAVLSDVVTDELSKCKAGRRMYLDITNKKWVFELIKGKELSLIISESALNAYGTEYIFDLQNYFTEGYYNREGESKLAIYRARPVTKTGVYRWEAILKSLHTEEAQKEIRTHKIEEELNLKVKNLSYGKDYNLGDVVTVSIDTESLKRTKKYRIIGTELWEEHGDSGERPIFEGTEE